MRDLTLPQDLTDPASPATAPALFDASLQDWISYGALRERVATLAKTLAAPQKQLVLLQTRNNTACVTAYLAAAMSGHAVMLVDHDTSEQQLRDIINNYRPEWLLTTQLLADPGDFQPQTFALQGMQCYCRNTSKVETINPQLFLLLSTSGSTGSKKFVRLSYRNLACNIAAIIEVLKLNAEQRAILHLPLSYSFGLSVLHTLLASGGSVVLTDASMMQNDFWKLVQNRQCNLFAGVPSHFTMVQRLGLERLHVPLLKTWVQAGGKADQGLLDDFVAKLAARDGKIFVMYGQTEASPRMATLTPENYERKPGSVGQVIPGGQLSVIDDDGKPCTAGQIGEVVYRGPNVMLGYASERLDLARGDDMHGTLITGDYGTLDADGFLTVTGRRQRLAKIHGQRIMLDEVEAIGRSIAPCAAMDHQDQIVLLTDQRDKNMQEKLFQTITAMVHLPSQSLVVRYIPSLPLTAQGKIDYPRLRGML
jgi:long-chain acyl-CoA synthetase